MLAMVGRAAQPGHAQSEHPEEPLARVREFLRRHGVDAELRVFPEPLPTTTAAAAALGVEPARIAKTVVLAAGEHPVQVVAAGDRRVDRRRVAAALGVPKVRLAAPEEVRAWTGFVAGGVAPVAAIQPVPTLLDESLRRFDHIWAGGGVPEALLRLRVADLPALTGGTFAAVCEEPPGSAGHGPS
ncbi:MAG TPA: YbaK/EbsC family protein [Thermaerobacter sp.]